MIWLFVRPKSRLPGRQLPPPDRPQLNLPGDGYRTFFRIVGHPIRRAVNFNKQRE